MFRMPAIILLLLFSLPGWVAAEEEADAGGPSVQYIYFEPAFVINFGSEGRMRYLRTEIALKVNNIEAARKVGQHKPSLRNSLVFLLSAQEPDVVNSATGRESIRELALEDVRRTMQRLEGMPYVDDLFFNTFVVQN